MSLIPHSKKKNQILIGEQMLKYFLILFVLLPSFFLTACKSRFLGEDTSLLTYRTGNQSNTVAQTSANRVYLDPEIQKGNLVPFQPHDNALAMNIPYPPIAKLRQQLKKNLQQNLDFFKSWNPQGEAHITVITPPEFEGVLSKNLSMNEINEIAIKENIQKSDIKILGLGNGKVTIDDKNEETFFILISSEKLKTIRQSIHAAFVAKGGDPESWDYETFYPHITVGFTKRDLHIQDGVIKDVAHSLETRFQLVLKTDESADSHSLLSDPRIEKLGQRVSFGSFSTTLQASGVRL